MHLSASPTITMSCRILRTSAWSYDQFFGRGGTVGPRAACPPRLYTPLGKAAADDSTMEYNLRLLIQCGGTAGPKGNA